MYTILKSGSAISVFGDQKAVILNLPEDFDEGAAVELPACLSFLSFALTSEQSPPLPKLNFVHSVPDSTQNLYKCSIVCVFVYVSEFLLLCELPDLLGTVLWTLTPCGLMHGMEFVF